MKQKSFYILTLILAAIVVYAASRIDKHIENNGTVCDQEYALCTSAPCIPDPTNEKRAICFCNVQQGKSFGQTSCLQRKGSTDPFGVKILTSNYSLVEYTTKKTMTCPDGNPWTFCLDKKCTVDPQNPKRAICICDVLHTKKFITLGGNCDTKTCQTGYWSGATLDDVQLAMKTMVEALGLKESPSNYCPDATEK